MLEGQEKRVPIERMRGLYTLAARVQTKVSLSAPRCFCIARSRPCSAEFSCPCELRITNFTSQ
jgi:hypothetical protein